VFAGVSVEADRQLRLMGRELGVANEATRAAIASLDEAGRTLRDHVSNVLNGVLQGRLGAVAMALQSHLDDLERGGHPSSERLVANVTALLRLAEQDMEEILTGPLQPVPLDEALLILRFRWVGLVAIDWEIDDGAQALLDDDLSLLRWASGVIEHAVSNASRHGSATALAIGVSTSDAAPGWLRIRLRDNGTGPSQDAMEGAAAGRAITERGGTWALTSGERGGAELKVDLPGARWSSDASHDLP
jgi:signal transduction histidine kinase